MPSNLVKMLYGLVADLFKHLHKGVFGLWSNTSRIHRVATTRSADIKSEFHRSRSFGVRTPGIV
jgi:hypothetical protein